MARAPADILRDVLRTDWERAIEDSSFLEDELLDSPELEELDTRILTAASKAGIPSALLGHEEQTLGSSAISELSARLQLTHGLAERHARRAVETWARTLDNIESPPERPDIRKGKLRAGNGSTPRKNGSSASLYRSGVAHTNGHGSTNGHEQPLSITKTYDYGGDLHLVSPTGSGDFSNLNDALKHAESGDVIELDEGDYREAHDSKNQYEVTESVLIRPAPDAGKLVLRPGLLPILCVLDGIVRVEGFTFEGGRNCSPVQVQGGTLVLEDVEIRKAPTYAISLREGSLRVEEVRVHSSSVGINAWPDYPGAVDGLVVQNAEFENIRKAGIYAKEIEGEVLSSKFGSCGTGIAAHEKAQIRATGCEFEENDRDTKTSRGGLVQT